MDPLRRAIAWLVVAALMLAGALLLASGDAESLAYGSEVRKVRPTAAGVPGAGEHRRLIFEERRRRFHEAREGR